MSKHSDIGDGDTCPLFPEHGNMQTVRGSTPPKQYCPHVIHDGKAGRDGVPASRAFWPLYGFDDTVASYLARLDKAIREAGLPDLSNLEVK